MRSASFWPATYGESVALLLKWVITASLVLAPLTGVDTAEGVPVSPVAADTGPPQDPAPSIHSSDGIRGPLLSSVAPSTFPYNGRLSAPAPSVVRTGETGWTVVPGLDYSQWTQTMPQGPVRVFLLTARLGQPGLVLDQVSGATVHSRAPLSQWLRQDGSVAGVNADFFDISGTGAPRGVGQDRQGRFLHAPRAGWNTSFVIDSSGVPRVLQDRLAATIVSSGMRPITVSNFNSPSVAPDGIGLYTAAWGRTVGTRVVAGSSAVRQVDVRDGVVRAVRRTLTSGTTITGQVLIARGTGVRRLAALRLGQRVRVQSALTTPVRMAVGGSLQLLAGGSVTTSDNGQLHPRTAVGIDRDGRALHLVVIEGRSESSSGLTLLQLAQLLRSLGDEDALNLDGGGSSTMVAADPSGVAAVRNAPSDGAERPVPTGLGFRYLPPSS